MDHLDRLANDQNMNASQSPPFPPSSPRSDWSTPPRVILLAKSSDDIIQFHQLPPVLSRLEETERVHLACAGETCDILANEVRVAEHHYRRMILVTRSYELRLLHLKRVLLQAREKFYHSVSDTTLAASAADNEDYNWDYGPVPAHALRDSRFAEMHAGKEFGSSTD